LEDWICDVVVCYFDFGNKLQNLRVSSPAPVTICSPFGDSAR
jgi:hypothetical protein